MRHAALLVDTDGEHKILPIDEDVRNCPYLNLHIILTYLVIETIPCKVFLAQFDPSLGLMNFYLLIFSFLRSGNKAKPDIDFSLDSSAASKELCLSSNI